MLPIGAFGFSNEGMMKIMRKKLKYHQLIQKNKKELLNNKDDLDRIDILIDQRRTNRKKGKSEM
jgi:hypothetical protein